jgi:hypothetical protein
LEIILLRHSRIQYNAALANLTPVHFIGALLRARRVRAMFSPKGWQLCD